MDSEYLPTFTMKINGKNVGKYTNRPMDGLGNVKVKRYVSCPPFQRLKVRVAAVLPAVPLLLQALPNTEELEATLSLSQWLFLVPLIGGRYHIITQLAIYKWYILPIGGLYGTYHLLREPETTID